MSPLLPLRPLSFSKTRRESSRTAREPNPGCRLSADHADHTDSRHGPARRTGTAPHVPFDSPRPLSFRACRGISPWGAAHSGQASRWGHIRVAFLATLRGRISSLVLSPAFQDASDRVPSFRSLGQNHLPAEALVLSRERAEVDAAGATATLGILPVPRQVVVARLLLAARERYQVHLPAPRRLPNTSPRSVNRKPPNLHRPVAGPSAA